jgi:hypothetical protein
MKRQKLVYLISTGLLSLLMIMSAGMYFLNHAEVSLTFEKLGFPTFIVYPLGIAKLTGLVAIWFVKSQTLKEWAYAGFFFNFILALSAHLSVGDGEFGGAAMALVLLFVSYFSSKKTSNIE